MALKKVYFGTVGPFLYDDADDINDADGDFSGETYDAVTTDGQVYVGKVPTKDEHVVRLTDLNSYGGYIHIPIFDQYGWVTWTTMPLAASFISTNAIHPTQVDLTNYTQVRFMMLKGAVAGAATSKIILRYAASWSNVVGNWSDIGTSEVSLSLAGGALAFMNTGWIALAAGAIADVVITVVGEGGDGALSPTFSLVSAQFK